MDWSSCINGNVNNTEPTLIKYEKNKMIRSPIKYKEQILKCLK